MEEGANTLPVDSGGLPHPEWVWGRRGRTIPDGWLTLVTPIHRYHTEEFIQKYLYTHWIPVQNLPDIWAKDGEIQFEDVSRLYDLYEIEKDGCGSLFYEGCDLKPG